MKKCSKCQLEKPKERFSKDKYRQDGLVGFCKDCYKIYYSLTKDKIAARRIKNKEKIKIYKKNWDINNRDKFPKYYKKYVKTEKGIARNKKRNRRPRNKLLTNLRNRLLDALWAKNWKKNSHFAEYIGCTQKELMVYLESKFYNNMSWENYGKGPNRWQIDHTIPLGSAKNEEEMYRLCHYANLQPLWYSDHKIKTEKDNIFIKSLKLNKDFK